MDPVKRYMHAYMRAYMHAYMHAYIHACMHAYMHACMHTYIHIHIGRVKTGLVAAVTSAGQLPCKHVIHVTGPTKEVDAPLLRRAVLLALEKAEEIRCDSIALPAISSGIFGFPLALCAEILVDCFYVFASNRPAFVKRIVFVNIDIETATAMKSALEAAKRSSWGAATTTCPASTCTVAGCHRESWNGAPNQECCRTCKASLGRKHGLDCETKAAAMPAAMPAAKPVFARDPATVQRLMEMGFPEAQVNKALDAVQSNDAQLATEWLFGQADADEDALTRGVSSLLVR